MYKKRDNQKKINLKNWKNNENFKNSKKVKFKKIQINIQKIQNFQEKIHRNRFSYKMHLLIIREYIQKEIV